MTTSTVPSPPRHARYGPSSQAQRLAADAATAAELRTWQTHPDVVALRVESFRTQVDRLMWAGIVLGLCFTMTNVQTFAAAGAPVGSLAWWSAWLLDPMVSLVLLAVLRAEQVTTRYQVSPGPWPRVAKWGLLLATYVMNTWVSWSSGSPAGVVLHSVPPLVVVIAAETVTDLQHALTECVHRAHTAAARRCAAEQGEQPERVGMSPSAPGHTTPVNVVGEHTASSTSERLTEPAGVRGQRQLVNTTSRVAERATRPVGEPRRKPGTRTRKPARRKFLADYVAEARAAWRPEVVVSPAWVRQVTSCSRGLSSKVAATLNLDLPAQHTTTSRTEPEGRAA